MTTLIQNAEIITMDPDKGIIKGSILIEDGKIVDVYPDEEKEACPAVAASDVIDAAGDIVMPGMTNAHYHSYSNLLKGTENHFPLEIWSLYTIAYGHSLTDEDIYLAVLLGAAEMIRSGVTGCIDHFPHVQRIDEALKAYEESGMNVTMAPMVHDIPDHEFLDIPLSGYILDKIRPDRPQSLEQVKADYIETIRKWHGKNGKIHLMIGPNAPQRCSQDSLALCKELSDDFDLKVHTHLLETKMQAEVGRSRFPTGLLGRLDEQNLLNEKLTVAHAIWLTEAEIEQLKDEQVSVIHNPASNMILGSGMAPISTYLNKEIPVGLGTDASNCGTTHNLFEMMRTAAMMQRLATPEYEDWLQAQDILEMATVTGASIMEYGNQRGRIAAGYDADLVLLNRNTKTFVSDQDMISSIVFHENGQSVDSVMIKGEWVYRHQEILTFDEQEVIDRAQQRSESRKRNSYQPLAMAEELVPFHQKYYQAFHK